MGNIKKKAVPLSIFYLKYLFFTLAGILAVVTGIFIIFEVMVVNNLVYPANYAQEQAKAAKEEIALAETFSSELIPSLCKYVLFDKYGNVKEGNLYRSGLPDAWEAVNNSINGKQGSQGSLFGKQYYYTVVKCREGYCVMAYNLVPQYKQPLMRKYLLSPQNMLVVCAVSFILLVVVLVSVCFGRALKKKLTPLIYAAGKIQSQELGFTVMPSDIKEIGAVLNAIDNMRAALKESLESQWKSEQAQKEQILALAHDLKTPLTVVRGNAELLYDTGLTKEQEELAGYIGKSSLQMQDYVQKLLDITKYGYKLKLKEVPARSLLENITEQAEGLCAARNISFQKSFNCNVQYFMADKEELMRAFLNIFSNAAEYTPEGSTIYFETYIEDNLIIFKTTDTGRGFSEEALKHAKKQFYMDDKSRNSKKHSGIGLYMADLVIKQHNGELVLGNSGRTGGAEVVVKIPYIS